MTILYAEDDSMTVMEVQEKLENNGYEVIVAYDGNEALEKFIACKPDLIVLDVDMPGKDGLEVLQFIRLQDSQTPVIIYSCLIDEEKQRLEETMVGASPKIQAFLESHESSTLKTAASLAEILRRPEMKYEYLKEIDEEYPDLPYEVTEQVEIDIKYDGYIKRQLSQVKQFKKMEKKRIPEDIDYEDVGSLRIEAKQKLSKIRPSSIGQASRISGVSPADISVLLIYLEQMHHRR